MDRPRRANALDAVTVEQLLKVLDTASTEGTRALVLRGKGRHFCAGFDMRPFRTAPTEICCFASSESNNYSSGCAGHHF
ncbi:hypothetical protein FXW78_24775 [Rhodococcus opacus]|nr:hypothetical protein [Rhodococcus opacus]